MPRSAAVASVRAEGRWQAGRLCARPAARGILHSWLAPVRSPLLRALWRGALGIASGGATYPRMANFLTQIFGSRNDRLLKQYRKVVERQRGGFCFELNSSFAALLV